MISAAIVAITYIKLKVAEDGTYIKRKASLLYNNVKLKKQEMSLVRAVAVYVAKVFTESVATYFISTVLLHIMEKPRRVGKPECQDIKVVRIFLLTN